MFGTETIENINYRSMCTALYCSSLSTQKEETDILVVRKNCFAIFYRYFL